MGLKQLDLNLLVLIFVLHLGKISFGLSCSLNFGNRFVLGVEAGQAEQVEDFEFEFEFGVGVGVVAAELVGLLVFVEPVQLY